MQYTLSTSHNTKIFNQEVNVSAFYFKRRVDQLASFPKQMELDGNQYFFGDNGLRYLVQKGAQLVQLFDVSDGQQVFRLRQVGDEWRLISTKMLGMQAGV